MAATKLSKAVEAEWQTFLKLLSARVHVDVDLKQKSADEFIVMGEHKLRGAGLLRLARLFASPYGRLVPRAQPAMLFEECLQNICELFKSAHPAISGSNPRVRARVGRCRYVVGSSWLWGGLQLCTRRMCGCCTVCSVGMSGGRGGGCNRDQCGMS